MIYQYKLAARRKEENMIMAKLSNGWRTGYFRALYCLMLSGVVAMTVLSGCGADQTYTVSGKFTSGGRALSGVTVTLSGDANMTTVTDTNGNYAFTDIARGTYIVTPTLTSYTTFIPPYRNVFLDGLDAIGFSFSRSSQGRTAAGNAHTVALKNDGTVWAWGNNSNGQLGNGTMTSTSVPVQISGLTAVILAAGTAHTVALKSDGTVWAWGTNSSGQLGNGTITQSLVPLQVGGIANVIALAAGNAYTVAVKNDGTVWAWGDNSSGQLGNGTIIRSPVPVQVSGMSNVIAVAAGTAHTVALKNDGTVWTWGDNTYGQLGNGSITQSLVPLPVESLANIIAIAAGSTHTAALRNDIIDVSIWMWGNNNDGQLGIGSTDQSLVPVQTPGLSGVTAGVSGIVAIAAGSAHTAALMNDGTVWTWGNNSNGQLGIGNTQQSLVAVQVSGMTNAMAVAAGSLHTLVMENDDSVWGWGSNGNGQLGDGTTTDRLTPVEALLP